MIVLHQRWHERGHRFAGDMAAGLARHGIECHVTTSTRPLLRGYDAAIIWSADPALLSGYHRVGIPVLVAEAGYVGDRDQWTALGWDGLNGRADFLNGDAPPDRWVQYFGEALRPWRESSDGPALIMGQVEGDRAMDSRSFAAWAEAIALGIEDRPILFRPHPQRPGAAVPHRAERIEGSLAEALDRAAYVLTYSSTTGVEALIQGIPTLVASQTSMAYPIAVHHLSELWTMPEPTGRAAWAARLLYAQWTDAELRDGTAWAHIGARLLEGVA